MLTLMFAADLPTGPVAALLFALAAGAMAIQTYKSFRDGYMYRGEKEKVYRKKNPILFKLWFAIQSLFVAFLIGMMVNAIIDYL